MYGILEYVVSGVCAVNRFVRHDVYLYLKEVEEFPILIPIVE